MTATQTSVPQTQKQPSRKAGAPNNYRTTAAARSNEIAQERRHLNLARMVEAGPQDLTSYIGALLSANFGKALRGVAKGEYVLLFDEGCRYAAGVVKTADGTEYRQEQDCEGCTICMCRDQFFVEAVNLAASAAGIVARHCCKHATILHLLERREWEAGR